MASLLVGFTQPTKEGKSIALKGTFMYSLEPWMKVAVEKEEATRVCDIFLEVSAHTQHFSSFAVSNEQAIRRVR